ncbi:MAG: DNA-directed DNA polymerase [Candidatus Woesearchaeota archaeon]|nr:DNA-directed DNA polymerase [Candidatus Woesearchaeota archaeon]
MVTVQFFPIDIEYKVVNEKPVIYIFGRTIEGASICVKDSNFEPYFLIIAKRGTNKDSLRKKLEQIEIEGEERKYRITKTELINKKLLGKEIEAIKVYTNIPAAVSVIREQIKIWDDVEGVYEADILFTKRYLIDKGITPLALVKVEGEFVTERIKVPVLEAKNIAQFGEESVADFKILAFDIETYNPYGKNVDMEKNPIIMVSFYGKDFQKVITWRRFRTEEKYIEFVDSELELIERFRDTIERYKPELLVGYYSDGFDLPYLEARARKYKIKLDLGMDHSGIKITVGRKTLAQITGLVHIDIFKFVLKVIGRAMETDYYDLDSVANELLGEGKKDVELDKLAEAWDKDHEKLEEFCKYNLRDSFLTYSICEKVLPNLIELVKITGFPIFDVERMPFSLLVEAYMMKQSKNFNEIIMNRPTHDDIVERKTHSYKGGFVYEPTPGLYKDIVVFDYRSLYPTIISSHNIDPGMMDCDCCEGKAEPTPTEGSEQKHWFCKNRKGFIPSIMEDLITRRMRIKELIKNKGKHILLDARSEALKVLSNSFYGYLGFFGARWYNLECAQSVTAWGRYYIHKVIDKAKKDGFNVIYSDTDSVFLTLDGKTKNDAEQFSERINVDLPGLMELGYEGYYPAGIFVSAKMTGYGAKKKYALLPEDGKIKIKGFETVRRNWSVVAKETQENVLNIILKENNKEKAFNYVQGVIADLKAKKVPLYKVVIYTQMQKEIKGYDSIGPHVAVAKRMEQKGIPVGAGSMIKYVIAKSKENSSKESISERARLPEEVTEEDYDPDYYIKNQVVPSVEKIFEVLGYRKEDFLESKEQHKLDRFF